MAITHWEKSERCAEGACVEASRTGVECPKETCVELTADAGASRPDRLVEPSPSDQTTSPIAREGLDANDGCVPGNLPGTDRIRLRIDLERTKTGASGRHGWHRLTWKVLASAVGSAIFAAVLELAGVTDYTSLL